MRYLFIAFLLMAYTGLHAQSKTERAIRTVLDRQAAAWNAGDLEAFMADYWHSPELQFVGSSGLTTGWQATLDNYREGYPDRSAMGTLTFDILDISPRSKKVATVVGKWHLQREKDAPQGHFLLVFQKIGGRWQIVADHSS